MHLTNQGVCLSSQRWEFEWQHLINVLSNSPWNLETNQPCFSHWAIVGKTEYAHWPQVSSQGSFEHREENHITHHFLKSEKCLLMEDFVPYKTLLQVFAIIVQVLYCSQLFFITYDKYSPSIFWENESKSNLFMLIILLVDKSWNV